MIKTKDELIADIRSVLGDSDEAIALVENVSDTMDNVSTNDTAEITRLKAENTALRQKYLDRFSTGGTDTETVEETEETDESVTLKTNYEELFE